MKPSASPFSVLSSYRAGQCLVLPMSCTSLSSATTGIRRMRGLQASTAPELAHQSASRYLRRASAPTLTRSSKSSATSGGGPVRRRRSALWWCHAAHMPTGPPIAPTTPPTAATQSAVSDTLAPSLTCPRTAGGTTTQEPAPDRLTWSGAVHCAVGVGFEPTVTCATTVFKTVPLGRSGNPPVPRPTRGGAGTAYRPGAGRGGRGPRVGPSRGGRVTHRPGRRCVKGGARSSRLEHRSCRPAARASVSCRPRVRRG